MLRIQNREGAQDMSGGAVEGQKRRPQGTPAAPGCPAFS